MMPMWVAVVLHVGQDVRGDDQGLALIAQVAQELAELPRGRRDRGRRRASSRRIRAGLGQQRTGKVPDARGACRGRGVRIFLIGLLGEPDFFEPEGDALVGFAGGHGRSPMPIEG